MSKHQQPLVDAVLDCQDAIEDAVVFFKKWTLNGSGCRNDFYC